MSSEVHPLYAVTIEGARHPVTHDVDSLIILAKSLIVQKDSNVQLVFSGIMHTLSRAKRFKSPFKEKAIEMAMNDLYGLVSISSEQGAYTREFNTQRTSIPIGQLTGQAATDMDIYIQEQVMGNKGKLKNNPRKQGLGIDF